MDSDEIGYLLENVFIWNIVFTEFLQWTISQS